MKEYKDTRSTMRPLSDIEFSSQNVFTYQNIHSIKEEEFDGYEYDMIEYSKDEYFQVLKNQNDELTEALADIIGGAL